MLRFFILPPSQHHRSILHHQRPRLRRTGSIHSSFSSSFRPFHFTSFFSSSFLPSLLLLLCCYAKTMPPPFPPPTSFSPPCLYRVPFFFFFYFFFSLFPFSLPPPLPTFRKLFFSLLPSSERQQIFLFLSSPSPSPSFSLAALDTRWMDI